MEFIEGRNHRMHTFINFDALSETVKMNQTGQRALHFDDFATEMKARKKQTHTHTHKHIDVWRRHTHTDLSRRSSRQR